jgi:hypothetical protein
LSIIRIPTTQVINLHSSIKNNVEYNMDETNRILSYKLATILEQEDLEKVSGGLPPRGTMRTQQLRTTKNGDTTIEFDGFDFN